MVSGNNAQISKNSEKISIEIRTFLSVISDMKSSNENFTQFNPPFKAFSPTETCNNGHYLSFMNFKFYFDKFKCEICDTCFPCELGAWRCGKCKYDLCAKCYLRRMENIKSLKKTDFSNELSASKPPTNAHTESNLKQIQNTKINSLLPKNSPENINKAEALWSGELLLMENALLPESILKLSPNVKVVQWSCEFQLYKFLLYFNKKFEKNEKSEKNDKNGKNAKIFEKNKSEKIPENNIKFAEKTIKNNEKIIKKSEKNIKNNENCKKEIKIIIKTNKAEFVQTIYTLVRKKSNSPFIVLGVCPENLLKKENVFYAENDKMAIDLINKKCLEKEIEDDNNLLKHKIKKCSNLSSTSFFINAEMNFSIFDIKFVISKKFEIEPEEVILLYEGRKLEEDGLKLFEINFDPSKGFLMAYDKKPNLFKFENFTESEKNLNNKISILKDRTKIEVKNCQSHFVILGDKSFSSGIVYWEIEMKGIQKLDIFSIGVATKNVNRRKYLGSDLYGFGFTSKFVACNNNIQREFEVKNKTEERNVMGVILDMNYKQLSYVVGGKEGLHFGIVFSDLPKTVWPAVSILAKKCSIRLGNFERHKPNSSIFNDCGGLLKIPVNGPVSYLLDTSASAMGPKSLNVGDRCYCYKVQSMAVVLGLVLWPQQSRGRILVSSLPYNGRDFILLDFYESRRYLDVKRKAIFGMSGEENLYSTITEKMVFKKICANKTT